MHDFLKSLIEKNGPLDVGQFMALALGHPQFGYYMKQDPFGAHGDFTTAPEISQMFGEMVAAWILDVWQQMGAPELTLLECGPGRGTLMADIMRSLKNVPDFHGKTNIHLMEMSPVLKAMQGGILAAYEPQWHANFETVPSDRPVIVIANEFLDALPVRQLVKAKSGWDERVVALSGDEFVFKTRNLPFDISVAAKAGDIFEISPARSLFSTDIVEKMKDCGGGAALLIDYGHVESGVGDTLQALKKHEYVSPLKDVGDADITTHVDFFAAKQAAENAGGKVSGPVEQGEFLKKLGIGHRAETLKIKATDAQKFDIEKALQRLTDSSQMGSLFKVMGITYGQNLSLAGF